MVVQRVKQASVKIAGNIVGSIEKGVLVFLGVHKNDTAAQIPWLAQKLVHLRIFHDEKGKMNVSLLDIKGSALIVSQFTLYANCSEGRRPDFFDAAGPDSAKPLYEKFVEEVRKELPQVATGVFGADMEVSLINDGPVTLMIDGKE